MWHHTTCIKNIKYRCIYKKSLPESKWELSAKLGLKNDADMTSSVTEPDMLKITWSPVTMSLMLNKRVYFLFKHVIFSLLHVIEPKQGDRQKIQWLCSALFYGWVSPQAIAVFIWIFSGHSRSEGLCGGFCCFSAPNEASVLWSIPCVPTEGENPRRILAFVLIDWSKLKWKCLLKSPTGAVQCWPTQRHLAHRDSSTESQADCFCCNPLRGGDCATSAAVTDANI